MHAGRLLLLAIALRLFVPGADAPQNSPAIPATLVDLTVPENRLPDGCRLRTRDTGAQQRQANAGHIASTPFEPNGVRTNPWTGRDRSVLVAIRETIEGPPRVPDGPPLTVSETAAFVSQLAEGVEEGYAATYAQPIGRDVLVEALRFASVPTEDLDLFSQRPGRLRARVVFGSVKAVVIGDDGPCSRAIETHVRSLVRYGRASAPRPIGRGASSPLPRAAAIRAALAGLTAAASGAAGLGVLLGHLKLLC